MIVTTLDTFTSLISGITIFAVLGNLAHELGQPDITRVIGSGGTGLAFISYPDAIAKSPFVPQVHLKYLFIATISMLLYLPSLHIFNLFFYRLGLAS